MGIETDAFKKGTYMTDDKIYSLYSLLQMTSINLRLGVAYLLGDGNTAVIASSIFEYLLRCYYSFIKNDSNSNLIEKYDGYMCKTAMDIHDDTFTSLRSVKPILTKLQEAGLIDFKNGGFCNTTVIKITDNAGMLIENAYAEYDALREEKLASKRDSHKKQTNESNGIDFKSVNNAIANDDYKGLIPIVEDDDAFTLVYVFSKYYRDYTGEAYNWNAVKFNTLNKEWKKAKGHSGAEIGLTIALKKELNKGSSSYGGKIPLEKRIAYSFNKDAKMQDLIEWKALNGGYEGVIFHNLLKVKNL